MHALAYQQHRGFTLIEALIYIALSGGMLAAVFATIFPLFANTESMSGRITAETESVFVLRKVSFMLSDAIAVTAPNVNASSTVFAVDSAGGGTRTLRIADGRFEMEEDSGGFLPITASRIQFGDFTVSHTASTGSTPRMIELRFSANGAPVGPLRYYVHF